MSISELFLYRNGSFQSDIFSPDIGIIDFDVGCRISPTLISMSMPTLNLRYCCHHFETGENLKFVKLVAWESREGALGVKILF